MQVEPMKNKKEVVVEKLPKCDLCDCDARYDAKTSFGTWAYLCCRHWQLLAASKELGLGIGQNLVTEEEL